MTVAAKGDHNMAVGESGRLWACGWRAGGNVGEGVMLLMGGRRTSGEI